MVMEGRRSKGKPRPQAFLHVEESLRMRLVTEYSSSGTIAVLLWYCVALASLGS